LPESIRKLCGNVAFRVDDFPGDHILRELGAEDEFEIMGLFQGEGMAHDEALHPTGRLPNVIYLYRRPILDYWAENEENLGAIISHVLIHEIGHHFGFSDEDMQRLERQADE